MIKKVHFEKFYDVNGEYKIIVFDYGVPNEQTTTFEVVGEYLDN